MATRPPFYLVMLHDRPAAPDGMIFNLYFINNTDEEIVGMREDAVDSFPSDEPVYSNVTKKDRPNVPAKGFICIDAENDYGMDLTTYYGFYFKHGGENVELDIKREKYFSDTEPVPEMGEGIVGRVYYPKNFVPDPPPKPVKPPRQTRKRKRQTAEPQITEK
jgi:hypothetical protein